MLSFLWSLHRKKSSEGTYDLPHWDRTGLFVPCEDAFSTGTTSLMRAVCAHCAGVRASVSSALIFVSVLDWWKSMKQLLPSKMAEGDDSVRYSSSEVGRLRGRGVTPRLHAEPAGRSC